MYRVLYRKWRPKTFSDVAGQPHITETLMNEVRENRLAHAYLFTGSRGTGKTSCAKILSKAINCINPCNGNPCNECEICKGIDSGSILDVVEIDAASNRGIDDIRALREESAFSPARTKFRVYIIDEVHMLTIEAFNALLKTLEEPPEHIVFILATTEVQKLPSTILSRCQRFDFRRISVDAIVQRLKYVAENESACLSDEAAVLIARIADGGMRDALSIFDRCLSINENVTAQIVSDAAGIMSKDYLFALCNAFKNKNTSKALSIVDDLHDSSCDTERLCTELTNQFRNLLVVKSVTSPENILVCTNEELAELKKLADDFTIDEILNIMNILSSAIASIKVTQNRRVETEMAIIKICSPEASTDVSALFARISKLEKMVADLSQGKSFPAFNSVADKQIKENENIPTTVDINSLQFDDDSDEYDDFDFDAPPPPSDEYPSAPYDELDALRFDEPVNSDNIADLLFDDESDSSIPVFDEEPTSDDFIFDEQPAPTPSFDIKKVWTSCIIQAEKDCPPIIGHLVGTKAEIVGNAVNIYNYNTVLPIIFPMVKDKLTETIRKVTGLSDLSVRLS